MNPLRTVARAMLAAMYIDSGWRAYKHPERLAEQAKPVTDRIAPLLTAVHPNAPTDAQTLVKINGAVQVAGGVLLATGKGGARTGALLLAATAVPTTFAPEPFWQIQNPTQRAQQRTEFLKNLSMLGGLLVAAMDTGGQPSLAWRTGDLARKTRKSVDRTTRDTRKSVARTARDTRKSVSRATGDTQKTVRAVVQDTEKAVVGAARDAQRSVSRAANVTARKAKQLTGS